MNADKTKHFLICVHLCLSVAKFVFARTPASVPAESGERHRSAEEHRRLSFIAFGGPRATAGLSPGWAS